MKEDLLHFAWQSKILFHQPLQLVSGEKLSILNTGIHNKDAGPDFFNAKIKLDETTWAGNIEIHLKSSDWKAHRHHQNSNYENVILHVVYQHDTEIHYQTGKPIPTLELKNYLPVSLMEKYEQLMKQQNIIACEKVFKLPSNIKMASWLERLLVERLEQKTEYVHAILEKTNQHWEQAFYRITARYFGMKTNAEPFEWLAERLPLQVIAKHKNNHEQLEALVFGVAGFLDKDATRYQLDHLCNEFHFLRNKYDLNPLDKHLWKFSRIRPANFPTIRLKQFAALLHHSSHLFSKVIEATTLDQLMELYTIKQGDKNILSKNAINLLLINSVLPVLFLYGKINLKEDLCERALGLYEELPAEANQVIRFWEGNIVPVKNAFDTQALLQLKTRYCDKLKCLNCAIGHEILLSA